MAGDSGTEAGEPLPSIEALASAKASPSAGASLTPATTAPSSSIVLPPVGPLERDEIAVWTALRLTPIAARRATTAGCAGCAGPMATSEPYAAGSDDSFSP